MKTEVQMIRFLEDHEIRQKSKSGMFNATDLLKFINYKRASDKKVLVHIGNYFASSHTKEFILELSKAENLSKSKLVSTNKKAGTWVHPLIMIDIALWGYPKLKVAVYKWMYDELIQYRNKSGNTFKMMNKVLDATFNIGVKYWVYANIADIIAKEIGLDEVENKWQIATKEQLRMRVKLQREIMASAKYGKYKNVDDCIKEAIKNFRVENIKIKGDY